MLEEEGATSLRFLQTIYRNPEVPLPVRMKAAAIAIEYEHPRLAITATLNSGDFADQLEQAVKRSRMIEAKPINTSSAGVEGDGDNVSSSDISTDDRRPHVHEQPSTSVKPMTIPDRRYRKW